MQIPPKIQAILDDAAHKRALTFEATQTDAPQGEDARLRADVGEYFNPEEVEAMAQSCGWPRHKVKIRLHFTDSGYDYQGHWTLTPTATAAAPAGTAGGVKLGVLDRAIERAAEDPAGTLAALAASAPALESVGAAIGRFIEGVVQGCVRGFVGGYRSAVAAHPLPVQPVYYLPAAPAPAPAAAPAPATDKA